MLTDLRLALRSFSRAPMFTGVAVASLALGIGANTAVFSLFDQVLLRSLPVREPERLVLLHTEYSAPGSSSSDNHESVFSYPMYREMRDRNPAFDGVVARSGAGITLSYQGNAEAARADVVSGNLFAVLGVPAALGRVLTPEDDAPSGGHPVAVLSHGFWSSRVGRNPAILNQTILVNGHPGVGVGGAEERFRGLMPGSSPALFVPIAMKRAATPTWDGREDVESRWLNVFARLKPGLSLRQAQAASEVAYRAALESELARRGRMRSERAREEFLNHRAELRPAAQGIADLKLRWEKPLAALMAMVGLVLLIACANVANLMLARASGRQREIAIRLAMGAGRGAIMKQLLLEGLALAVVGGLAGLLVAVWSAEGIIGLLPEDYAGDWLSGRIDFRLFGFNLALSVASGLLFALVPAVQATRPDVAAALKSQSQSVAAGGGAARFRRGLVTAQVALSLILVVGAGLFARSLFNLSRVDLGFRAERVLMATVDVTTSRPEMARAVAFYRDLRERLAAIRSVSGVGAADSSLFSGHNRGGNVTVEGYQAKEDEYTGGSQVGVSPGFFAALGVPLRAGREFGERDSGAAPKVVVVNEAFVKRYFAGRDPIGRRLMFGRSNRPTLDREIVGVVGDARSDVRKPARETIYFPFAQWFEPTQLTFYVRVNGDESRVAQEVRRAVRESDPNVPVRNLAPMTLRIGESFYTDRLIALLAGAFGALAALLAAVGLYGVIAYTVARRTAEVGVRMALGATPAQVLRMVLADAGRMALAGIAIGLAGAAALSRLVESQLFGVRGADPAILALASALLVAVAALAAALPALRASRINPVSALKYE
jgi:predicted permease